MPTSSSLCSLFERQTDRSPAAIAASHDASAITYSDLDRRANQLAHFLKARGVGADVLVAIAIERSIDMVVAVLAVLKAGGAYVPLDPAYPEARLAFMLEDTQAPVLLTTRALEARLPRAAAEVVCVDARADELASLPAHRPAPSAGGEHLAYVIYTSGSTGTPKGVAMTRRPLENLIQWQLRASSMGPGERTLQFAPLSFDVHFQELFATWASGGELVLVDDDVRLDARRLLTLLEEGEVARLFLPFIALQTLAEVGDAQQLVPRSLREVVTAGEQLVVTRALTRFFERLPACTLHNHYGPSETHVVTAYTLAGPPSSWPPLPPIGQPIDGATVHLLDESQQPVAEGAEGELYLGGLAIARGYLHRPELTAAKFVPDPFSSAEGARLYRTGDLGRIGKDGNIEFLGRLDGQVKVRGYRIELGEIEVALGTHPAVAQAVVIAREDDPGDKRLVAYVQATGAGSTLSTELRRHLSGSVPEYMVPSTFVAVADFPRTPSGKIDRRALPRPEGKRPELETQYVAPRTELEEAICRLWARLLKIDRVGALDDFFDLGGNSLLALQTVALLRQERQLDLPIAQLFAHPTASALASHLAGGRAPGRAAARTRRTTAGDGQESAVAIIGMAGRFPGARNVDELWQVLRDGRDTTTLFAPGELDPLVPQEERSDSAYVRRRGVLEKADCFDAAFFGVSPREAEVMDPQQRILLETAWEALESAGYTPEHVSGTVGVFAGTHNNSYYLTTVLRRPDAMAKVGAFTAMAANEKDYVATRIAHKLDLRGPALSLHTACSTSLVAVAVATNSLLRGDCDMALAGGASVTIPSRSGYLYQEGGMLSNDGHTRAFDARARGTTFSDGAGMVVLKRLADAQADGDTILAVIRGAALNNDGSNKMSFTAPSVEGQATVVATAHSLAGVDPRTISYVEAHGTATPLGDPIEVEALTLAFREKTPDRGFCALGSVKSNFGHLTAAAGVTGLIKTVLALRHELLPKTVHFESPNPHIDFAGSPFRVVAEPTPWPRSELPRRAGVSAFGVGGTNAHVVVEEAPRSAETSPTRPRQVLLLSARSPGALDRATDALRAHLSARPELTPEELADVAFTLHAGRRAFSHRRYAVVSDAADAANALATLDPRRTGTRAAERRERRVVFLFPGQGAQYVGMGASLYRDEPLFRLLVDQCADLLLPHLGGQDLRSVLYPPEFGAPGTAEALRQTRLTQPALFTIEYALANLWLGWGIRPELMVGHSVGELVCAVLAGVMSLGDALALVAARGRLMQELPPGAMLSVRLPAAAVEPRLTPDLAIASTNGPSLCVVSGPAESVQRLAAELEAEGVVARPLHTSHAFHSPMMEPAVEPFAALVRGVTLSPPRIPFVSTVTARVITPEQATDPEYWARHLRETVRFAEAVAEVWQDPSRILLEVGPRTTLATLARQQIRDKAVQVAVSSLGDTSEGEAEWASLLTAVGQLWENGVTVPPRRFYEHQVRRRVPLPTYPFEPHRHWLDAPTASPEGATSARAPAQTSPSEASTSTVRTPVMTSTPSPTASRKAPLLERLKALLEEASGIDFADADPRAPFLELGLDSLFLTQIALSLKKQFGLTIGFRQLLEDLGTLDRLADHMLSTLPLDALPGATPPTVAAPAAVKTNAPLTASAQAAFDPAAALGHLAPSSAPGAAPASIQHVVEQQLALMRQQLALLTGAGAAVPAEAPPAPVSPSALASASPYLEGDEPVKAQTYDVKKAFGAIARIHTQTETLSPEQKEKLDALTRRYNEKTKGSKSWTQTHRKQLADPRVVTGFRPAIKELVYPIVAVRSSGSRLWDIDGNEYVDALNGFGSNYLGHAPKVVTDALKAQIDLGYEIGPMQPTVGDCAKLVCQLTGHERAAFCNTGSEAVMGALRVARTVTGRNLVVVFSGSYHGIFDEVIVRGTRKLRSIPAAPGVMPESVENVLVLDYGTPESMALIKERAHELAAVMVEPVQSRRPDFQPVEFLRELRGVTEQAGAAYIWDEVITGFRAHPGGAQALFGVKADLATYGKVAGGGMPLGMIAGKSRWMDALDGGDWQFGDESVPTVGVTYFAGTFVRHPLTMAATKATLEYLVAQGPALQERVNARTEHLARTLNAYFEEVKAPVKVKHFASLWKAVHLEEHPMQDLLFCHLRDKGIHIWDGFPCFLTDAHSDADVDRIIRTFRESVDEMQNSGFFPARSKASPAPSVLDTSKPPLPGARLGRDPNGNPAWYVPNPAEQGKYMKVES